ncbi:tRNA (guanine-N(7)-)-methyltransferase [Mycoplasmopsis bovigenitalium]|uniref:tRNA (guanine-N(7)-)-methyltransferase n=1 Tax=Mycoplasmopsis bovigenitalium TaxID=2112 RepID=A0A449A9S8_9BACT|nr:tRNA (guanosine(46)-N7)-methyltransferase TrmB [Mycoplasmopsis bovigenitalium]VEU61039.1 tRNA (guanine-N(7)-)-methyltransferase [Mycoplasmopsis bovigenitalium]
MRLRFDKTAEQKIKNSNYFINETNYPIELNNKSIVELGMGKGEMIVELALKNQDIMFYGFEKYPTVAAKALAKAEEYNLKNFKIILDDASNLENIFIGTLNTLWLTFSDPWPKARHFKRRLTYKTFLEKYAKIMNENSILKLKTDNDKFFEFSLEQFNENNWNIIEFGQDLHNSKFALDNVMTGYEKKWSSLGKNINYLHAKLPSKQ